MEPQILSVGWEVECSPESERGRAPRQGHTASFKTEEEDSTVWFTHRWNLINKQKQNNELMNTGNRMVAAWQEWGRMGDGCQKVQTLL